MHQYNTSMIPNDQEATDNINNTISNYDVEMSEPVEQTFSGANNGTDRESPNSEDNRETRANESIQANGQGPLNEPNGYNTYDNYTTNSPFFDSNEYMHSNILHPNNYYEYRTYPSTNLHLTMSFDEYGNMIGSPNSYYYANDHPDNDIPLYGYYYPYYNTHFIPCTSYGQDLGNYEAQPVDDFSFLFHHIDDQPLPSYINDYQNEGDFHDDMTTNSNGQFNYLSATEAQLSDISIDINSHLYHFIQPDLNCPICVWSLE